MSNPVTFGGTIHTYGQRDIICERSLIAEQRARKTCFRKNVAEDDVSTGHSPRMRLAREAIAKRYFADENKLDAELYVCLCPP